MLLPCLKTFYPPFFCPIGKFAGGEGSFESVEGCRIGLQKGVPTNALLYLAMTTMLHLSFSGACGGKCLFVIHFYPLSKPSSILRLHGNMALSQEATVPILLRPFWPLLFFPLLSWQPGNFMGGKGLQKGPERLFYDLGAIELLLLNANLLKPIGTNHVELPQSTQSSRGSSFWKAFYFGGIFFWALVGLYHKFT